MTFVRRWRAWIVLAASVIGAVWIYSLRISHSVVILSYVDPHGRPHYDRDHHLGAQPWWSTPGAVLLVVIGMALFVRLLPARTRILRICTSRLPNVSG